MLSEKAIEDLARSGIQPADAKKAGLYSTDDIVGVLHYTEPATPRPALVIPYFSATGEPVCFERGGTLLEFRRVRFLDGAQQSKGQFRKRKAPKYGQPAKSGCRAYFPPLDDWQEIARDPEIPVVFTEGEKKALRATLAGVPTIGLGGVHNFMRGDAFLPELEDFEWRDRQVFICFDSDAADNPQIQAAEGRLASELSLNRKASVFLARTPELAGGRKAGIDDYIVARGEDEWMAVLDNAPPMRKIDKAVISLNEHIAWIEREGMALDLATGHLLRRDMLTSGSKYSALEILMPSAKGTVKRLSVANEWLKHPHARRYDEMIFRPDVADTTVETEEGARALNIWRGLKGAPGDITPFLTVYDYVMSRMDEDMQDLVLKLMTYKAQNPGEKIPLAPMLIGPEGSGKSLLADCFREAFGRYGIDVSPGSFSADYNDWMEQSLLATVNELRPQHMRGGASSVMWSAISDKRQTMNAKYRPARQIDCYTLLMFTSNKPHVAALSADDRRMIVISAPPKHPDPDFYAPVYRWREQGGPKALMHWMLNHDLEGWKPPTKAPMTAEKYMAYMESLTAAQRTAEDIKTADEHVVYMWIEQAMVWARTAELSNNPDQIALAQQIQSLEHIEVRPWYSVDELSKIFPMLTAELYNDRRRTHSAGGELSRQLREAGVSYLRNLDDPRGFLYKGRIQQFLVVADPEEWSKPISQADFEYCMKRFPRFKEYRAEMKKRS